MEKEFKLDILAHAISYTFLRSSLARVQVSWWLGHNRIKAREPAYRARPKADISAKEREKFVNTINK